MTRQARTYTPAEQAEALAALTTNGGNAKRTARELSIPESTLRHWRNVADAVADGVALARVEPDRAREPLELWRTAAELAGETMIERLKDTTSLKDASYAGRVANDNFLDHRDGRKGTEVHVDARSVHLPALEALSTDELRALIARETKRQEEAKG